MRRGGKGRTQVCGPDLQVSLMGIMRIPSYGGQRHAERHEEEQEHIPTNGRSFVARGEQCSPAQHAHRPHGVEGQPE
jgi:hypothetical protein